MLKKDPIYRPTVNELICHPIMKDACLDFIKGDAFKKEYLHLAQFIKTKDEESKEEEGKSSSTKKGSSKEKLLYQKYVNKIEDLINPPEECKPARKK